jgi:tetratricopeptide (TPR) repeat protein
MKPSLMLNMIVKNESARIERCLRSALPHVKAVTLFDTGSTDDTCTIAFTVCKEFGVPIEFDTGPFDNFSQARNDAFEMAQRINGGPLPWCQFALLMDADMELVVDDPDWGLQLGTGMAASFDMMQKGGAISYANRRIVNLDIKKPPYVGVTHEYIDVPATGMIHGARFIDHADGANRTDKYERDVTLLEAALKSEPNNARYWYYLGNSYRDWGRPIEATVAYRKRIALGGWDEETHSAMMHLASCAKDQGLDSEYVARLNEAFNFRPSRAEPLYDLAKYYREKGKNAVALLYAKHGMSIPRPDDLLFVNDFVYSHGLRYEYSITGYYDPKERPRAFEVTDDLSLDPTCDKEVRYSARSNLYWHTEPLSHYCPSFRGKRLDFEAPAGYTAMNPSVTAMGGRLYCNIRCVNYRINEHGQYMIGERGCGDAPIDTRNFIAHLDADLATSLPREIIWARPPANFDMVTGLEDIRLWSYCGTMHFNACVRERSTRGTCQQIIGSLSMDVDDEIIPVVSDWRVVSGDDQHEKNWMPMPSRAFSHPRFVYRLDTIIEPGAPTLPVKHQIAVYPDLISGSSQLVEFNGGYLAVVHEAVNGPDQKRTYWHRFAWFEKGGRLRHLSLPFVFYSRQIEFCAGLALHPNGQDLILSFGVRDAEAHVATVSIEDVTHMIWKSHEG